MGSPEPGIAGSSWISVAELSWTPMAGGKHLSAYRLHTPFEVLSGKAVRIAPQA